MQYLLLILIFIRPFISSLAFPYANYIYSVLLLGFLAFWVIAKGLALEKVKPLKNPLLLFILALFISLVFSYYKIIRLNELNKYAAGILLFLITIALAPKEKNKIILFVIASGLLISLLAIYQYFFGFRHLLNYIIKEKISNPFVLDYVSQRRVFYPFLTPNTLGGYLAMLIPLALIYKHKFWMVIALSFALLLTKSIAALLSIFLALIVYFYLQDKLRDKKFIFFFSGMLGIIASVILIRASAQKQHLQPMFSTLMRLNYWHDAVEIIKLHPLAGVGLGNFNLAYSRYAHNSYLQLLAEMGIMGIISFLWLVGTIIYLSLKSILQAPKQKTVTICLFCATFAFLTHNLMDFTFFLPEVSLIWWILLGALYSFSTS